MNNFVKPTQTVDAQAIPTEAQLLERARGLLPMLMDKAESVEKNRMVSSQTIEAFVDAGFFKILQPKEYGGWEMAPAVFYKVLVGLGRGCCSSAWVSISGNTVRCQSRRAWMPGVKTMR